MADTQGLKQRIQGGTYDALFATLYGNDQVAFQKSRYTEAVEEFEAIFGAQDEVFLFSAPGRTEIGGNHTDHNHGRVLAGSINLDVIGVVAKAEGEIRVKSKGFDMDVVSLDDLSIRAEEEGKSCGLLRGLAAGFVKNGHKIGGYVAYTTSNVLKGSGLSSSAAFEVLNGTILSHLYNGGAVDAEEVAKLSQYAENVYFGKPCGLLDQMACAIGGIVAIDFKDTTKPVITKVDFDFAASGHKLCIVDTGGNHANLTPEYAAVPAEMKAVAKLLGVEFLRETDRETLIARLPEVREACGDRAALRAFHFFMEDARVDEQAAALKANDFEAFKQLILTSGHSSYEYLQNVYPASDVTFQGLSLALCLAQQILAGVGAWRVHGGGFAGTTQNFVPEAKLEDFCRVMTATFGDESCHVLFVRPFGGICLDALV